MCCIYKEENLKFYRKIVALPRNSYLPRSIDRPHSPQLESIRRYLYLSR